MNAISGQFGLPRTHGTPCPRLLAKSRSLREDAAEAAWELSQLPNWAAPLRRDSLLRQHEALTLRSIAAHEMAHGNSVIARHYLGSARRVEAGQ